MAIQIIIIAIGFVLLIKGADWLVIGARNVAKKFNIPEMIIGLTVVSIGTSMPEFVVSVSSAIKGYSDIAIGNIVGSNICNLLLILGITAVIQSISFKKETRLIEIPITLIVTVIFFIACNIGGNITRIEGIIFVILFLMFIMYTIYMARKGEKFDEEKPKEIKSTQTEKIEKESTNNKNQKKTNMIKSVLYIIIGIIALKIGGDFVVENAILIAKKLEISEKIISLTIIAVGTSLPELFTSVVAAIKGDKDIAIGNILGSNIFNILLILGLAAIIKPITYPLNYNIQVIYLIGGTIMLSLFSYIGKKNEMTRINGCTYIILYIIYLAGLIILE